MINHLRGIIDKKFIDKVIIEVSGIGYEVNTACSVLERMPSCGTEIKLFVFESSAMYGGSVSLYGFLSEEERDMFLLIKEEVPGTGAKKALDYFDKIVKSLPDFKRCIISKDISSLISIFGFTKKTADKLISALKEKLGDIKISGTEKFVSSIETNFFVDAVAGLVALGYRENQAKEAVKKVSDSGYDSKTIEDLIRKSLQYL